MKKHLWTIAALTVTLVAGTSCATSIDGTAKPGMTPVDLSILKTGGLATAPSPFKLKFSDTGRTVRMIEARRMLNYLVHPFDVDSDLTNAGYVRLIADATTMTADGALPEIYKPVAEKNRIVAGAYVSRTNGNLRSSKKLIVSILRFPTEADSKNAADDFFRITQEQNERHAIPIDGHPDAHATSADDATANGFQQYGPYVIAVSAGVPTPNPDTLAGMIKKVIDLQIVQLDKQKPIPIDDLLDLPTDPDGIMRRTAPRSNSDPFLSFYEEDFGNFQASGILHFERNPIEVRKAFEEGGVDLVGRRSSTVYRARDLEGAFHLQKALTRLGKNDAALDPPPGLSDAQCVRLDNRDLNRSFTSYCAIVYDRYVAVVVSTISEAATVDRQLQERASAQYSILKKSE